MSLCALISKEEFEALSKKNQRHHLKQELESLTSILKDKGSDYIKAHIVELEVIVMHFFSHAARIAQHIDQGWDYLAVLTAIYGHCYDHNVEEHYKSLQLLQNSIQLIDEQREKARERQQKRLGKRALKHQESLEQLQQGEGLSELEVTKQLAKKLSDPRCFDRIGRGTLAPEELINLDMARESVIQTTHLDMRLNRVKEGETMLNSNMPTHILIADVPKKTTLIDASLSEMLKMWSNNELRTVIQKKDRKKEMSVLSPQLNRVRNQIKQEVLVKREGYSDQTIVKREEPSYMSDAAYSEEMMSMVEEVDEPLRQTRRQMLFEPSSIEIEVPMEMDGDMVMQDVSEHSALSLQQFAGNPLIKDEAAGNEFLRTLDEQLRTSPKSRSKKRGKFFSHWYPPSSKKRDRKTAIMNEDGEEVDEGMLDVDNENVPQEEFFFDDTPQNEYLTTATQHVSPQAMMYSESPQMMMEQNPFKLNREQFEQRVTQYTKNREQRISSRQRALSVPADYESDPEVQIIKEVMVVIDEPEDDPFIDRQLKEIRETMRNAMSAMDAIVPMNAEGFLKSSGKRLASIRDLKSNLKHHIETELSDAANAGILEVSDLIQDHLNTVNTPNQQQFQFYNCISAPYINEAEILSPQLAFVGLLHVLAENSKKDLDLHQNDHDQLFILSRELRPNFN